MDNNTPAVDVKIDLYFVECFTGQKWVPLDCLPKASAERSAAFLRLGAVKPEDVRLVALDKVMENVKKDEEYD